MERQEVTATTTRAAAEERLRSALYAYRCAVGDVTKTWSPVLRELHDASEALLAAPRDDDGERKLRELRDYCAARLDGHNDANQRVADRWESGCVYAFGRVLHQIDTALTTPPPSAPPAGTRSESVGEEVRTAAEGRRNAAIMTILGCNTRETLARWRDVPRDSPDWSPAFDCAVQAVEREIEQRERATKAEAALAEAQKERDLTTSVDRFQLAGAQQQAGRLEGELRCAHTTIRTLANLLTEALK